MVYLRRTNIKIKRPSNKLDHTKLGPFKIKEKLGLVIYKLDLPGEMRIYPVFYVSLLETALESARPGLVEINEETRELKYEIDSILGTKLVDSTLHYLTYWKGY